MDDRLGDFASADLLVVDGRIADIAPSLDMPDAEIVDARARILAPGFVNAHMHTWQTSLRGLAANWTLLEYFRFVHAGLATLFTPQDIGIATLLGALNQLNCGTTTLVDWCHNNPTPAHTDAAIDALLQSGIRAAFFHGSPKPDPKPGEPHFSEVAHPRHEIERLLSGPLGQRDGLVTLGMAILGPHYSTLDVARQDFRLAREFDLVASMHQGGGPPRTPGGWKLLVEEGLVGPRTNIVHGNDLTDDELARFVDLGVSFSLTPQNEMTQGHGTPIIGRLRKLNAKPSLGIDLESVFAGDMLGIARIALSAQRMLDNSDYRARTGTIPDTGTITVREALAWITIDGARMLGLDDRIGSLTPGKFADITIFRADDLNMAPVLDPVASILMQAGLANIDAVLVAGEFKKHDGRLCVEDLAQKQAALTRSGARIAAALGLVQKEKAA
jgi:cytosine/adenosine deaminase-related metal-dependent hydrolase